jgi:hypothetical protein
MREEVNIKRARKTNDGQSCHGPDDRSEVLHARAYFVLIAFTGIIRHIAVQHVPTIVIARADGADLHGVRVVTDVRHQLRSTQDDGAGRR